MNPELIIPVGSATRPIPRTAKVPLIILPVKVIGVIGAYPIGVMVIIAPHKAAAILGNPAG
jgi:hypothetical protein